MGGNDAVSNALRFGLVLFLQVFLFRQISLGWGGADYLFVFLTPLFVALLPIQTPRPLVVLFAFLLGLSTDYFYEALGLHAAAATLVGYLRQYFLRLLEPRDGYKAKANPDGRDLAFSWWMRYLGLVVGSYCFWYFSMQAFSPVYWQQIALKVVLSFPVSWVFCLVFVLVLRPRL